MRLNFVWWFLLSSSVYPSNAFAQPEQELVYKTDLLLLNGNCASDDSTSASIFVECGEGGIAVPLNEEEGLGLAFCESTGRSTLTCSQEFLNIEVGYPTLTAVFACRGSTDSALLADVYTEEAQVDCAGNLVEAFSRTLTVSVVCPNPNYPLQTKFYSPGEGFCLDDSTPDGLGGCSFLSTCGGNFSCDDGPVSLPSIRYENRGVETLPSSCVRSANPTAAKALPSRKRATYELGINTVSSTTDCTVPETSPFIVRCGEGGTLLPISDNLESCNVTSNILECSIDNQSFTEYEPAIIVVVCEGSTTDELSMSLKYSPGQMFCSAGDGLEAIAYSTVASQVCPSKTTPLGNYADLLTHECYPASSSSYNALDLNGDGEEDLIVEACAKVEFSCAETLLHEDVCSSDGSTPLEPIQSTISGELVDVDCLSDLEPNNNDLDSIETGDLTQLSKSAKIFAHSFSSSLVAYVCILLLTF